MPNSVSGILKEPTCVCTRSYLTLCGPMDCSPPGSSVHENFQVRILEQVAISFSRGIFPTPGSNPCLLLGRQILYHCAAWVSHCLQADLINNELSSLQVPRFQTSCFQWGPCLPATSLSSLLSYGEEGC